ncbi:hypothetical protein HOI04_02440, partial [archaeon]|nr:hypothetical protein [archaeon]
NAKFEPKENKIIHGAGQSLEAFSNYWNAVEDYKPAMYMTYAKIPKIQKWIETMKIESKKFPNIILQIGLKILDSKGEDLTLEVLGGKYDKDLNEFFKTIKEFENPVFLRIGYEFDKRGKYDSKNFILAWKYIVDMYKKMGVKNIATVWCAAPYNGTEPVEPYYPGDKYVDWFGIDIFLSRHLSRKYDPIEKFLELAIEHKKPVMVGESTPAEVGVLEGEKSWGNWFEKYFRWINSHKQIKAFCYINWDWAIDKTWGSPGTWGNCRIEENEIVRKKFVRELGNPKYIHNQKMEDFLGKVYTY